MVRGWHIAGQTPLGDLCRSLRNISMKRPVCMSFLASQSTSDVSTTLPYERATDAPGTVAIIGAGIAGLVCAQMLSSVGIQVVVFDKARAPGGRITTRRRDDFEWDMGAQMFTAENDLFVEQVRDWQTQGLVRRWRGRFAGSEIGQHDKGPFYVGLPRMGDIAKAMARGLDVRYPIRIDHIHQDDTTGNWSLTDEEGGDHGSFQTVLSAMPKQQTEALFGAYPEMRHGLKMAGSLAPTWSLYVAFRERLDVGFDAKVLADGPLKLLLRNNAKPERPARPECWVVHADADMSEQYLENAREEMADELLTAFEQSVEKKLPPVVALRAHRWRYAVPMGQSGFRSMYDNRLGLGFMGDWVQPPTSQFGGVEAAFLSGRALAQQAQTLLQRSIS